MRGRQVIPATVPMWVLLRWPEENAQVQQVLAWEVSSDDDLAVMYPLVVMDQGSAMAESVLDMTGRGMWSIWSTEEAALAERQRLVEAGVDW